MKAAKAKAMKAAMKGAKVMKAPMKAAMKAMTKSKSGKIVSKAASARGKKRWAESALKKWIDAVKQAHKELGITGFCAVNGKTAQGKALFAKTKAILGK